jgi:hypothetical protein
MSIEALNWAFQQAVQGPAKAVLIVLADHVDQDGWCWPAVARLCFRSGFAVRTVQMALRQLEREGHIRSEAGTGRGHVSRYKVLHNPGVHPAARVCEQEKVQEMPPSRPNGAADAPFINPVKGAENELKGAGDAEKGAGDAPKPLRTTKKNHQGRRARAREAPPERNVYDQILEELGGRSLLLPPLPEHNPSARPRLQ